MAKIDRSRAFRLKHEKESSLDGPYEPLFEIGQKVLYGWDDELYIGSIIDIIWYNSGWEYQISPELASDIGDNVNLWWGEDCVLPVEITVKQRKDSNLNFDVKNIKVVGGA